MKIYLMRHSETDWNRAGRIQGQTNTQLNRSGIRLAAAAGAGMAGIPFDICFTSPLIRASQTASIVLSHNDYFLEHGLGPVTDPRIQEIGFGVWEGLHSRQEFGEVNRADFEDFYLNPNGTYCPEGGERLISVIRRSNAFIDELISIPEYEDKTILVLTHGCTMRCILSRFSDDPEYFRHPRVPYNCESAIMEKNADGELILSDPGSIYYDSAMAHNFYGG